MRIRGSQIGRMIAVAVFALLIGVAGAGRAVAQSTECAKEGERCAFLGTATVMFGVGNKWTQKVATSSIQCGLAGFGVDPAPGELKTCTLPVSRCAREGGRCQFTGVMTVRYGAGGTFAAKTFKDGMTCGTDAFGYDPVPGVRKDCFLGPSPNEKPINEVTWLGTHNAISSTYYGFFIQQSQRDSVTAQLERGARALEIDTVQDRPVGFAEGVYVCHCGAAPHSLSAQELGRFASGKDNQTSWPFQLPGWTHPTPYMRFSTILKEIDKWMIANPGEVVFILMENNSANPTQLDAEISAAGLQTKIYKHPNDDKWPTRSELVRQNKRLIFQVSDDKTYALGYRGITNESIFATPKYKVVYNAAKRQDEYSAILQYGALAPPAYGNVNEYSKDKADTARAGNQLLVLGAFQSAITDESTARAHNNYGFLKTAKMMWDATGQTNIFYPSILQVNQIHIGDALRFVNDINGTDYLISSAHDTIGDTSGNSWQIRFENNAAFNAGIVVQWWTDVTSGGVTVPVPGVAMSGNVNVTNGVARMVNVPRNTSPGKPITVTIAMYSTSNFELYKEEMPANFTGSPVPCFAASGVLTSPKGGRCE